MSVKAGILVTALLLSSCTGVRSVQLTPPTPVPPGLIWGYGVEKIRDNPDRNRQSAYLKAIDDLLTRGPVVVSKTVQDHTTVLDAKSATRTMESTFRLRASRMLQPSFMDTGVEDGFVWVLVGTMEADIERGWQQFVEWRTQKIEQAQKLYQDAKGPERVALLKAALEMLEEAGAGDDPGMLYYQVKTAIETENTRIAELETLQKQFRSLTESGQLVAAETALDHAQRLGLDQMSCEQFRMEIEDRRKQAAQWIAAGDDLFRDEQYKEALDRYQRAQQLDRDNPQLPTKLAMADRYHRTARSQTVRSAVGVIGVSATRALGEYFAYKREQEERKRAEAEKAAAEAKKKEEKEKKEREKAEKAEAKKTEPPPAAQPHGTVEHHPERRGVPIGMSPP
jgi:tetratricopeptide (TPR) repeat protein